MTPESILIELLDRILANKGSNVFIATCELNEWPSDVLADMKTSGLLEKAPPAKSTICPGCEQACSMPIHTRINQDNVAMFFVFCDKRNDINRVSIPLDHIEQWQTSGYSLAKQISKLLDLPLSGTKETNSTRWEIGLLRGKKHSSHVVLTVDNKLHISAAGQQIVLDELLSFVNKTIKIDRRKITQAIDNPAKGGGDIESASERYQRLQNRVNELKSKGIKGFLKITAEEDNISVSRLKQILDKKATALKKNTDW